MDSGFSSPRTDAFPAGLRVLVVDDDLAWLCILEKMLKKCSYEVTTSCLAREALDLLRERKDGFDIVISDVNMPDMDGFKLLEHVGLEMDLPVIMMSVDGETSRVMRGVQHGACDYLLKPIRMKELRNIWQHVFRKRIHEVRDIEDSTYDELHMMRLDHSDDSALFLGTGDIFSRKKRKDAESNEFGDSSSVKKARVVWTVDLHQKFVIAVNQIGLDKVGPKKILDMMNVAWLTRENVASHLQKYRLYLSRLQKEKGTKAYFGATKQTDQATKDHVICASPQIAINLEQNNGARAISTLSGNKTLAQNVDPKFGYLENIVFLPIQEPKNSPILDSDSFRPVKHAPLESKIQEKYFWNQVPETRFKKENGFNQLSQTDPTHHFQVDCESFPPFKKTKPIEIKKTKTVSIQGANGLFQVPASVPFLNTSPSMKNQLFLNDTKTSFASSGGDLFSCLLQADNNYKTNIEIQNKECFSPSFPELFTETTSYYYESQRLDYEYQWESTEYPVIDQGLFIV